MKEKTRQRILAGNMDAIAWAINNGYGEVHSQGHKYVGPIGACDNVANLKGCYNSIPKKQKPNGLLWGRDGNIYAWLGDKPVKVGRKVYIMVQQGYDIYSRHRVAVIDLAAKPAPPQEREIAWLP